MNSGRNANHLILFLRYLPSPSPPLPPPHLCFFHFLSLLFLLVLVLIKKQIRHNNRAFTPHSPDNMGLLDPATSDGRVIFFLPWEKVTIAGTTDTPTKVTAHPIPGEDDINFILREVRNYLSPDVEGTEAFITPQNKAFLVIII